MICATANGVGRRVAGTGVGATVAVRPDMRVFGLYVGLTASGYDLANIPPDDPIEPVMRAIRTAEWPAPVFSYFGAAKRPGRRVNPYWPRAAMLLEACLYLSPGLEFSHTDELDLLRRIAAFSVSRDDKDAATVAWVREFSAHYAMVAETDLFPLLWPSFLDGLESRMRVFEKAASGAFESFVRVTGVIEGDLPQTVVVPNPLQAPQVADFVRRDGTVFVVVAEPRMSAVVHELLHIVFEPILRSARPDIVAYRHLLRPVLREMMRMQYAWDDDEESWFRVFEENLMRAAAIWVEHPGGEREASREAARHAAQGFIYVPALLGCLRERWPGHADRKSVV